MQVWRESMPKGMHLKSEGFASFLFDPDSSFTLEHYCAENSLPYAHVGIPVPLETFAAYGVEFQKRLVPTLEETNITSVKRAGDGFELQTANGETFRARKVVIATGIAHFGYLPPMLADLSSEKVTHSSAHHDLSRFKGQKVAVIGGGSSAIDLAALLNEQGAEVHLIARRKSLVFHKYSTEPRPRLQQICGHARDLALVGNRSFAPTRLFSSTACRKSSASKSFGGISGLPEDGSSAIRSSANSPSTWARRSKKPRLRMAMCI